MIGIQVVVHPYFLQPNHFLFLFSNFFVVVVAACSHIRHTGVAADA